MILAMDERGKIVEQGNFSDLNVPGRYVYSLKINHLQSQTEEDDEILPGMEDGMQAKDAPIETQEQDSSRQTGDWATYKYYVSALGRSKLLLFVVFVVINESANGIQCMPSSCYR